MENIATNNTFRRFGFSLCVLSLCTLVSCGDYISQYSEADGAYYDPESDTLPKYLEIVPDNRVGEVYLYDFEKYTSEDENKTTESYTDSIVKRSQQNKQKQQNKYQDWIKKESSDWGKNIGTKIYVYNNYYGYPRYNWYGLRYSYYCPYGGSFGWEYCPSWRRYYDPFWEWNYYPYRRYHRPVVRRLIPKYKERDADYIDRSRYNYGSGRGKYNDYRSNNNNDGNSSRSSSRGNVGGGFRR